jgi:hypothetical protein
MLRAEALRDGMWLRDDDAVVRPERFGGGKLEGGSGTRPATAPDGDRVTERVPTLVPTSGERSIIMLYEGEREKMPFLFPWEELEDLDTKDSGEVLLRSSGPRVIFKSLDQFTEEDLD